MTDASAAMPKPLDRRVTIRRLPMRLAGALMLWALAAASPPAATGLEEPWVDSTGVQPQVVLYFFWTSSCPHCRDARPFVTGLSRRHDWLTVRDLELTEHPENVATYVSLAERLGLRATSVPAFLFCGEMLTGFDDAAGMGAYLEQRLNACRDGHVLVSALAYFLFMAAWLNLFLLVGELPWMTLAAGLVAIAIGALNVKDYVAFHRGPRLSIPDSARPGLFARMRALVSAKRLPALIAGTLALAVAANVYELLCTAGFPLVFTRVLTLHELPRLAYYGYLALYVAVYVIPLLVIVAVFAVSLGGRRLSERQGRHLKLLSGMMMLGLGGVLVSAPQLLINPLLAVALLVVALVVTLAAAYLRPETLSR